MAKPADKGKTAAAGPGQGQGQKQAAMPVEKIKIAATIVIALVALAMAYYFLNPQQAIPSPALGNQINMQTFASVLSSAPSVYVVMDVRNADGPVKQNIIRCGVDFAGSMGLGNKTKTFYSLDKGESCITENGTYSSSWCFGQMENGVSIIIQPGDSSGYYANAMVVGMGENYTEGECSVNLK
jgi:hypothetical protein